MGTEPGNALDFHSLGLAGSESTTWGRAGWRLQQFQREGEEMTARGLERSRDTHKVLPGLPLAPVHSYSGLAPAQFKDRGPDCAQ